MRKIKFRAWDSSEKEMVCWPVVLNDPDDWWHELLSGEYDDDVVMQFTGLKDKNGNEIYEGDVIECRDLTGQVGFRIYNVEQPWEDSTEHVGWIVYNGSRKLRTLIDVVNESCMVIGNVYENPELLNK